MDSIQAKFDSIVKSDVNKILSEGFAQLYREHPNFPVTYLAEWLKKYSSSQRTKSNLINLKKIKTEKYDNLQKQKAKQIQTKQQKAKQAIDIIQKQNQQYQQMLQKTIHLQDLLNEQLPQFIQKSYNLTGTYIGQLDYSKKPLQQHNFQLGAQNNTQNPKIISYIGACKSNSQLMINKILPHGQGRSYQIFEQGQQTQQNNQEGKPVEQNSTKKKYIYVENVQKQKKIHYFKYPKLGAYACFPIKLKSYLNISTLQKGIVDYKTYIKTKQQIQKQYNDKLNEAKTEAEEANKKFEEFEGSEDDPVFQEQKKILGQEAQNAEQKLKQLETNPPIVEQTVFNTIQKLYFLGCDTLGQDRQIIVQNLDDIQSKLDSLIIQWQQKQKKMLLNDILAFLEEQPTFDPLQIQLQQFQKNIINTFQSQIKQQFSQKKQKQGQFEFSIIKAQKNRQLFKDQGFKNSMQVYLNYKIPKYTQIIQIWCMLLGQDKKEINTPYTNRLNHRKIINKEYFEKLFDKLEKYQLRKDSSQNVPAEYKINKLLERLQKIQLEALAKYNSFLLLLHSILKIYCWTRILCRDARKQTYQTKLKLKQQRDAQILKWNEQIQKKLESAKAQLDEQGQQTFQEEQWRKTYQSQNPKPQVLDNPVYLEHLDIQ